jgi:serine/threonine protein kinase
MGKTTRYLEGLTDLTEVQNSVKFKQNVRQTNNSNNAKNVRRVDKIPYRNIKTLGSGGFGTVFLVEDNNGNEFAMKQIEIPKENRNKNVKMVINEIEIQKSLSEDPKCNTGIVCVYDYFYVGDYESFYIIMEYINNKFSEIIGKKQIVTKAFTQALQVLDYIHKSGVLHRDIKPENMFFDGRNIKFSDFGISCLINSCSGRPGTRTYIDPYCLVNDLNITKPFSDVYSLGIAFYEIYYGKAYFDYSPVKANYEQYYEDFGNERDVRDSKKIPTLLYNMINPFDPEERPSIQDALGMIQRQNSRLFIS